MALEKDFNKLVRLKITSVILFIITILAGIASGILGIVMSNHKADNTGMIVDNFVVEKQGSFVDPLSGDTKYNIRVKGSFMIFSESSETGTLQLELFVKEKSTYTISGYDFNLTEKIDSGMEYEVDFVFESELNYDGIWRMVVNTETDYIQLYDKDYYNTRDKIFIPVTAIGGVCLIISILFTVLYNVKKKKKISDVEIVINATQEAKKQPQQPTVPKCPYCGSKVDEHEKTCSRCGGLL